MHLSVRINHVTEESNVLHTTPANKITKLLASLPVHEGCQVVLLPDLGPGGFLVQLLHTDLIVSQEPIFSRVWTLKNKHKNVYCSQTYKHANF